MITFPERLARGAVAAAGVYDPLSALIAAEAGFEALFLSGSALSYASLGAPDVGLIGMSDVADACARITDRANVPVLVDMDSGFGSAAHVARAVRLMDRAAAAAVQIEDQEPVKSAGALTARPLVPAHVMVGKIKAAQDARTRSDLLISVRTDAMVSAGFDEALRRAETYIEAGADLLFVEALKDPAQFAEIGARFGARLPLVHNLFAGGPSPAQGVEDSAAAGYRLVLFSGAAITAAATGMRRLLGNLAKSQRLDVLAGTMPNAELNDLIGTPDYLKRMAHYA